MQKRILIAAFVVFGTLVQTAQAQVGAGLNVQYGLDSEELQLGGELHLAVGAIQGLSFVPNVELYLIDEPSIAVFNANFHYAPSVSPGSALRPYGGLGAALVLVSQDGDSTTDVGVNLVGGINFRAGTLTPFVQLEFRAGDASDLSIGAGLRFVL